MNTSIIILTYNKLDYTKTCVESIRKFTDKKSYELIIIDNNSTDDTPKWLKEQKDIKAIYNEKNLGFPKGCNQGIEISTGDNILLLNNDTIVTPNWLNNLISCLYSSTDIGAVGPVTNYCSYYQQINTNYKNTNELIKFAEKYNVANNAMWEERLKLIAFCMLIKKEVIGKIGLLDERFTPGNFEDDDYSYRIRKSGYKIILCKDTFIHHYGSISFKEKSNNFGKLLQENKQKFQAKWGFDPHSSSTIRYNLIDLINAPKDKEINILDIGCGCGGTLLKIKSTYKESNIYGIEINKDSASIAKTFAIVQIGNIEKDTFDYKEQSFDYIILGNVLEHLNHPEIVLIKIRKYLKEDGKLLVSSPNILHNSVLKSQNNSHCTYTNSGILDKTSTSTNQPLDHSYPLVSILIPAYNRVKYLEIALNSALNQTYKNIEIIISDDSTNSNVETMIKNKYLNKYPNLKYYKNKKNIGQYENDLKLLDLAKGEYINFLMDDDVFAVTKIEKMMFYFINDKNAEVKLITSHRQLIDKYGNKFPCKGITTRLFNKDTICEGLSLGNLVLVNNFNCIGEPTTPIFRKKDLIEPFGYFNGRKYGCNVDTATWLNLLSQGKIIYISETLSYFRVWENQQLQNEKLKLLGCADYAHEILTSPQKGFLQKEEDYIKAVSNCLKYCSNFLNTLKIDSCYDKEKLNELNNYYNKLKNFIN